VPTQDVVIRWLRVGFVWFVTFFAGFIVVFLTVYLVGNESLEVEVTVATVGAIATVTAALIHVSRKVAEFGITAEAANDD
jgi:hypothetical protein